MNDNRRARCLLHGDYFDYVDSSEAFETGRTRYTQWQKHMTGRDLRFAEYYLAAAVTHCEEQTSVVLNG